MTSPLRPAESTYSHQYLDDPWGADDPNGSSSRVPQRSGLILDGQPWESPEPGYAQSSESGRSTLILDGRPWELKEPVEPEVTERASPGGASAAHRTPRGVSSGVPAPAAERSEDELNGQMSEFEDTGGVCEMPPEEYGFWLEGSGAESADRANGTEASWRGNNNAERTKGRTSTKPYAEFEQTADGKAAYAGIALIKSHDERSNMDVEVYSASVQGGSQMEAQAGGIRLTKSGRYGEMSMEALTARYSEGIHNDDGSTGYNRGFGATLVGGEGTVTWGGGNSVTAGASLSLGVGGSVGIRDQDGDGRTEYCVKASYDFWTVGVCLEE